MGCDEGGGGLGADGEAYDRVRARAGRVDEGGRERSCVDRRMVRRTAPDIFGKVSLCAGIQWFVFMRLLAACREPAE